VENDKRKEIEGQGPGLTLVLTRAPHFPNEALKFGLVITALGWKARLVLTLVTFREFTTATVCRLGSHPRRH